MFVDILVFLGIIASMWPIFTYIMYVCCIGDWNPIRCFFLVTEGRPMRHTGFGSFNNLDGERDGQVYWFFYDRRDNWTTWKARGAWSWVRKEVPSLKEKLSRKT